MHKRSLGTRIWIIADKYNIEQRQVHRIIKSYIGYCKKLLIEGNEVTISCLVTLKPDFVVSEYKTTLAYQCKAVSCIVGLSYHTVYSVVKEYLDFLKDDILKGNSVDIWGIVSLHPLMSDGVVVKIHSSISKVIKRDLLEKNGDVSCVRAHTHKLLRHSIKSNVMVSQGVCN